MFRELSEDTKSTKNTNIDFHKDLIKSTKNTNVDFHKDLTYCIEQDDLPRGCCSAKIMLPSRILIGHPLNLLYPIEYSGDAQGTD